MQRAAPRERLSRRPRWSHGAKLTTPSATDTALQYARDARWGPAGLLAVAGDTSTSAPSSASDYVRVLRLDGNALSDLGTLPSLPAGAWDGAGVPPQGTAYSAAWAPDGDHLAVGLHQSPFVHIYSRTLEATFAKLSDPATLPGAAGRGVAYSPCGRLLAVAHDVSPYVTIYQRSGATYTKLSNPGTLPAGFGVAVAFSPDGQYLAVGHDVSPYVTIYAVGWASGAPSFTKLSNPSSLPAGWGLGVAFSADSRYMAVGHVTSPFVTAYRIDGATFTKIANPSSLPPSNVRGLSWAGNRNRTLLCSCDASPYHIFYELEGDVLAKLTDLPSPFVNDLSYTTDQRPGSGHLAIAGIGGANVHVYATGG